MSKLRLKAGEECVWLEGNDLQFKARNQGKGGDESEKKREKGCEGAERSVV